MPDTFDVFLSYNSKDEPQVKGVAGRLHNLGLSVWLDKWKLRPGLPWQEELEEGVRASQAVAVFVGKYGLGDWQRPEMRAFIDRSRREKVPVIPVLLPGCPASPQLTLFLKAYTWVDLRGGVTEDGLDELVWGITGEKGKVTGTVLVASSTSGKPSGQLSPWKRWGLVAGLVLLVALLGGGFWWARRTEQAKAVFSAETLKRTKVPRLPRPSVAVLTFENRSKNPDLDWLATALSEAVSAKLGLGDEIRAVDRHEVALAEMDLLLPPAKEIPAQDLGRLRQYLGVESVVTGAYELVGGTSTLRLELALYNTDKSRLIAEGRHIGETAAWLDLADRVSEGSSSTDSFRKKLGAEPLTLDQSRNLRALFPVAFPAAKLYAQGLERYRRFDVTAARDALASVSPSTHPLVLAVHAYADEFLGNTRAAAQSIKTALAIERQIQNTPLALPERYRRELEMTEGRILLDQSKAAERAEIFFREYFPDDLAYGLLTVDLLTRAGATDDAQKLIGELRRLPMSEQQPQLDRAEADTLFVQQKYSQALEFATQAAAKARMLGAVREEAISRFLISILLSAKGDTVRGEEEARQARNTFELIADRRGMAQYVEERAIYYADLNLPLSERLYREAMREYEALRDPGEIGRALLGLKSVLLQQRRHSEAAEISRRLASLSEATSLLNQGIAKNNQGYGLFLQGRFSEARDQYEEAKDLFDKTHSQPYHASALASLGEIELALGNLEKAKEIYDQVLSIQEPMNDAEGVAFVRLGLLRIYLVQGNYFEARREAERLGFSRPDAEGKAKEPETLTEIFLAIAELELLTGKPALARQWAQRSEKAADGVGIDTARSRALALQVRALLALKDRNAARQIADQAGSLASGDFRAEREAGIAKARVEASFNEVEPALEALTRIVAESARTGQLLYELESRLAAGEIELEAGLRNGRPRLEKLRDEANSRGFGQIARRVDNALGSR